MYILDETEYSALVISYMNLVFFQRQNARGCHSGLLTQTAHGSYPSIIHTLGPHYSRVVLYDKDHDRYDHDRASSVGRSNEIGSARRKGGKERRGNENQLEKAEPRQPSPRVRLHCGEISNVAFL